MKIAFYIGKNGNWRDRLVCFASRSFYSHCELVMDDGFCLSASPRDGGVRGKYIRLDDHWHVYEVVEEVDEKAIRYWFEIHRNLKYDLRGAIASAFGIDWRRKERFFCSYVCAIMLGIDPIITPGKLYRVLKKRKMICMN